MSPSHSFSVSPPAWREWGILCRDASAVEYSIYGLSSKFSVFSPIYCYLCRPGTSWVLSPPNFWERSVRSPLLQRPPCIFKWCFLLHASFNIYSISHFGLQKFVETSGQRMPSIYFCELIHSFVSTVIFRGWKERSWTHILNPPYWITSLKV